MSTKSLDRLEKLYQKRSQRAEELRRQGKKIIGYLCCYPPLELMTALELVPYRIMGTVRDPVTQADAYLETIMCPFVRSSFDLAVKGQYDFLDGLVVPHSCDTVQRIYDIWRHYRKPAYSHFINIPHMLQPSSYEFFKNELIVFQKSLERFASKTISPKRLVHEIQRHNEQRGLLRDLYQLRKSEPPLISGTEVTKTLVVTMSLPIEESNELLRSMIREVREHHNGPQRRPVRVLVYGCEIDDTAFVELVEGSGSNVVIDDLCLGTRHFWHDVPLTPDPLDGLVKRYLNNIPCPRTFRPREGSHAQDLENRFGYLGRFAREFNVNAAILYIIRYCDTHELDVPDVIEYLKGLGLPVLHIEDDYSISTVGQLRTRVQAFFETIC